MNIFDQLGSMNDSSGGIRGFLDLARQGGGFNFDTLAREVMTNAPHGVTQLTKAPWNFNE